MGASRLRVKGICGSGGIVPLLLEVSGQSDDPNALLAAVPIEYAGWAPERIWRL